LKASICRRLMGRIHILQEWSMKILAFDEWIMPA
jgi:hypothetical protein